jgi:KUP system potassium uptake protein
MRVAMVACGPARRMTEQARVSNPGAGHSPHGKLPLLALGALGVVFGDIGTSPLYSFNEIFFGIGGVKPTRENVLSCVSLVIWALTVVVGLKYVVLVLRADNDGEGGVFALYGLLHKKTKRSISLLLAVLLLAAGLIFGDGVITPAISVLSAVEGLRVATPMFDGAVVPITIVILTLLFMIQFKGTASMGKIFGPVLLLWFVVIATLGSRQILLETDVLEAFDPRHAFAFFHRIGVRGVLPVLGAVMLTITGGEALYADMGHFGVKPIRVSWFTVVYPCLILSYLGQGAYLIRGAPVVGGSVFYSLVPHGFVYPMVILATFATIIASQALISGAFSLAAQGIALGLFPRMKIVHTHQAHAGQIYMPFINWALYWGTVLLVLYFKSSSRLASAYGLAVSVDMLATSVAMIALVHERWDWSLPRAIAVFGPLALVDASFLTSNSLKFFDGGFIPLSLGVVLFVIMVTWRWGRKATFAAYSRKHTMTIGELVAKKRAATGSIDRNAVLMVPKPLRSLEDNTPALLQLLWDRYGMLPKNILFVEVVHKKTPYVHEERYQVTVFDKDPELGSVVSVTITFGFMEDPNVERVLADLAKHHEVDLPPDPHLWIVHVSLENLLPTKKASFGANVRFLLFTLLRHVSQPAYYYYGLGNDVQLSAEILPVRLS